ncbi:hypothetical protein GCM10023238_36780 [Streptomyces heliomycini]
MAAEPGRTFRWMMLTHARVGPGVDLGLRRGGRGDGASWLVHHFRMGKATAVNPQDRRGSRRGRPQAFIAEWTAKLGQDLDDTLARIKDVIEKN